MTNDSGFGRVLRTGGGRVGQPAQWLFWRGRAGRGDYTQAYLRPEMVVADIGSGTGFMAAGLAPLVARVYAIDASAAMLEAGRENTPTSAM